MKYCTDQNNANNKNILKKVSLSSLLHILLCCECLDWNWKLLPDMETNAFGGLTVEFAEGLWNEYRNHLWCNTPWIGRACLPIPIALKKENCLRFKRSWIQFLFIITIKCIPQQSWLDTFRRGTQLLSNMAPYQVTWTPPARNQKNWLLGRDFHF